MQRVGSLDFIASKHASLPNMVIITGKEHLLADAVLRQVVETVLPDESLRPLNVDTIDALAVNDFAELPEKLFALPFLATQRVVTIRNTIELRNDDRISLRDAIPVVGPSSVLIIDDSGEPKPQRGKAPKDKVHSSDFAVGNAAIVINCTLDAAERERYIEQHVQTLGVTVDAGARRYLAAFDSVDEIRNALDRLALTGNKITKAAAEEYVKPPGDPKLWDLGNAVGRGDLNAALAALRELVSRPEESTGPLIWIAGDAQIAWELSNGATPQSWAAATRQSAFRAIKLWDYARRRSPQQARDNVRLTMKALEDSLTGKRVGDQALEEIVIRLCTQK